MKQRLAFFLFAVTLGVARPAIAQDLNSRFNIRIGLTGMYLREDQPGEPDPLRKLVGPLSLGYGDLRAVVDARKLPGNFELHIDGRVRLTGGSISPDSTEFSGTGMTPAGNTYTANSAISARGYLGGREYQINELWARGRWSKVDLGLGRLVVTEADALRIDGVRVWIHAHNRWDVSLYAGAYPDPYSRSIQTDYVAGDTTGHGIAIAGGASAKYHYERVYGAFALNAAYLGGQDDGGPVKLDAMGALAAANPQTEKIRSWVTWQNFWRPIKYVDFYHDLVLDVAGAAGVQLTRLDFFAAVHINKYFTLRLGYDHMSSLAIEMYLSRLLANRTDFVPGIIDNNLTLSRIARDEGRATAEISLDRTTITLEGRFRRRVLATPSNDPAFLYPNATMTGYGDQVAPTIGWDATLAVRNRGSLWGLRPGFWLTYLSDYRARSIYAGIGVGREFWRDRISLDIGLSYANTRDEQVGNVGGCPGSTGGVVTQSVALQSCFGTRKGHNIQPSITLAVNPAKHWFVLLDYRAGVAISDDAPYVLTNILLARVEARY